MSESLDIAFWVSPDCRGCSSIQRCCTAGMVCALVTLESGCAESQRPGSGTRDRGVPPPLPPLLPKEALRLVFLRSRPRGSCEASHLPQSARNSAEFCGCTVHQPCPFGCGNLGWPQPRRRSSSLASASPVRSTEVALFVQKDPGCAVRASGLRPGCASVCHPSNGDTPKSNSARNSDRLWL